MLSTTAEILDHDSLKSRIKIESAACAGCGKGCSQKRFIQKKAVIMTVPGEYQSQIEVSLSLRDQLVLLTNSLLLPLLGFIAGGSVSNTMQLGEFWTVAGVIVGLSAGVAMCRSQAVSRMKIKEVRINE
jgi:positive regulator of sigma E activity